MGKTGSMKNFQKVRLIANNIKRGPRFFTFTYTKENGDVSNRTVSFGIDIFKRMEKQGTPVNGKGNWHSKCQEGKLGFTIRRGAELYVRGIDVEKKELRLFKVSGIQNLH